MPIIEVNHVTKEYRLGHMRSLKQSLLNAFYRLRGRLTPKQEGMGQAHRARVKSRLDPFLLTQVHSALAYYFDHQEEVDTDLAESSDVEFWKSQIVPHPNQKAPNV